MASQGPLFPGTEANDASFGSFSWTTGNAASCNNVRDESFLANIGDVSNYLKLTNFGFSIPTGATITGIEVVIERTQSSLNASKDIRVRIVKGGTIGSTDLSNANFWQDAVDETITYGDSSQLWGETWTPADINASTFGWALATNIPVGADSGGMAGIDCVKITVYYDPPPVVVAWFTA